MSAAVAFYRDMNCSGLAGKQKYKWMSLGDHPLVPIANRDPRHIARMAMRTAMDTATCR